MFSDLNKQPDEDKGCYYNFANRALHIRPYLSKSRKLRSAAFGIRIPARACFQNPTHPWDGDYIVFSSDGGDTWGNVIQLTSIIITTHYMTVEEMKKDNSIFVAYDFGRWVKRKDILVAGQ